MSQKRGNHLHLDCFSGIAGDMVLGSLIALGAPQDEIEEILRGMPLKSWSISFPRRDVGHGMYGTGVAVVVEVTEERTKGEHHHAHRAYREIKEIIQSTKMTKGAKSRALSIFAALARAESEIHQTPVEEVCFHEVGAVDSIIDIVGVAVALDKLQVTSLSVSPMPLSRGMGSSMHGTIPIPAPASLKCLTEVPGMECYESGLKVELVTPTGAAILAALATSCVQFPTMVVDRVAFGAGTRRLEDRPNLVRAVLGSAQDKSMDLEQDTVCEVTANIDDQTPEDLAFAAEEIRKAGALDVWIAPVLMKKSRPGYLLSAICSVERKQEMVAAILRNTTSLGVRMVEKRRAVLSRQLLPIETTYGQIRVKIGRGPDGTIWNIAPEADDCETVALSNNVPMKIVRQEALAEAWSQIKDEDPVKEQEIEKPHILSE